MKLTRMFALLVPLVAVPATSWAHDVDCPKPAKKKVKKRKKVTPPVKVEKAPCDCVGKEGPPGPPGPAGTTSFVFIEVPADPIEPVQQRLSVTRLGLGLGVMGAAYLPHGDWAWGPALQATYSEDDWQLAASVGLALGADGIVGDDRGFLIQAGLTKFYQDGIGLTGGVHITSIDGADSDGDIDGTYVGLDAGLVLRSGPVRFELTPVLALLNDDVEGDQLALGLASSLFVGGEW